MQSHFSAIQNFFFETCSKLQNFSLRCSSTPTNATWLKVPVRRSCLGQSRGEQVAATCVTPLKKGRGKREREREFCQLPAIYQDPFARAWFEDLGSVDPDSSILSRLQKPDSFTLSTISTRFWESLVHGETHRIADVPDLCH